MALARRLVSSLRSFDLKAKSAAADTLLETYNDDWREYKKSENGRMIDVSDPELSASEFSERLRLDWITIEQPDFFEMGYSSGRLFAGHSVLVRSFNGEQFTDLNVQLFG